MCYIFWDNKLTVLSRFSYNAKIVMVQSLISVVVQINKEINYIGTSMKFFETAKNERKSNDVKKQKIKREG